MRVYTGKGLGSVYLTVFRDLQVYGEKVTVRGHKCIEFPEPVTLVYTKPGACWLRIPGRKFNPFFALAEVVWILSGRGDIDWIAQYNARMRDFNDGDPENHGAYGLRMRNWRRWAPDFERSEVREEHWNKVSLYDIEAVDQVRHVVRKLKEDPHSRQAVISLWDPVRDNIFQSRDFPCNNLVYYKLRCKEFKKEAWGDYGSPSGTLILDQTLVIRSNDLVWGQPYNAIQFTHLHALVAGELNAEMGTLTYVINNLHYYEDLYPETLACIEETAAFEGNPGAESIPGFEPVTDFFFQKYTAQLDYHNGSPYWGHTIPHALSLFNTVRAKDKAFSVADCAWMLHELPDVLHWLVRDFWRDSKNETVQRVLEYEDKYIARKVIGG